MSTIFAITLGTHVILGIVGLIASFATTLNLLVKNGSIKLRVAWAWTACAAYVLSWLSGGYYYVFYYGSNVKPDIKAGIYDWGHLVFMEFKEHVFLFMPFATAALAISVTRVTEEKNPHMLNQVKLLSVIITVIAVIITASGVIITGSASG